MKTFNDVNISRPDVIVIRLDMDRIKRIRGWSKSVRNSATSTYKKEITDQVSKSINKLFGYRSL